MNIEDEDIFFRFLYRKPTHNWNVKKLPDEFLNPLESTESRIFIIDDFHNIFGKNATTPNFFMSNSFRVNGERSDSAPVD